MASKRNVRRKTCGTKVTYQSEGAARREADRLRHRDGVPVEPYVCPFCHKLHVGHRAGYFRRSIAARRGM